MADDDRKRPRTLDVAKKVAGEKDERSQADIAREALAMKAQAEARDTVEKPPHVGEARPREGMRPEPDEDQAPSGALDHGGQLPAMQRSKFARR